MQGLTGWLNLSIRTKMLLALAAMGLAGLLVLSLVLRPVVIGRFDAQERLQIERDTRRADALLQAETANLGRLTLNWAVWDDAYAYVKAPSRAFEDSNFVPGSFESMRVNLMMFTDLSGRVITARGRDLRQHTFLSPDERLLTALTRPETLSGLAVPSAHREGLIRLPAAESVDGPSRPGELWLIAVRPVTTNDGLGPVRGVLLLGRRIDAQEVQNYRQITQLNLQLPLLAPGAWTPTGRTRSGQPVLVQLNGPEQIVGRLPAYALNGQLATNVEVLSTRGIHALGVVTANAVLVATGTMLLLFTVLTLSLLESQVLSQLALYRKVVQRLAFHRAAGAVTQTLSGSVLPTQLHERMPLHAPDELGDLGSAFNGFLDEIVSGREQLLWQAQHDDLTGLSNRQLIEQQVTALLQAGSPVSLTLIDLNHFKNVNDTLGHQIGDDVLQEVARRLVQALPGEAVVARLGGDEFAVLLPASPEAAQTVLVPALVDLTLPIQTAAGEVRVSGSAGITGTAGQTTNVGTDWVTLLRQSDVAMYRAKRDGQQTCLFTPALLISVEERIALERALVTATERQELRLVYQPIVSLPGRSSGGPSSVMCVEALLRWRHPLLGDVSPFQFIPIAEENGSISALGDWVLDTALAFARSQPGLRVAVNVSAAQIGEFSFVSGVMSALQRHGVSPTQLELEVTETAVLRDLALATQQLELLHAQGVWITLDDFGTGHSSLAVLCTLPIQKVKLDRMFLVGSLKNARSESVLRAVIDMARDLHLEVVAEGIETEEQCARLQHLDCPLGQGYLFARPLEEQDVVAFLAQHDLHTRDRSVHRASGT